MPIMMSYSSSVTNSLQNFSNCGTGGCGTCVTAFMRFMSLRYFR